MLPSVHMAVKLNPRDVIYNGGRYEATRILKDGLLCLRA